MTPKNTVAIIVLTYNSSAKIRECLDSAKWASEIIVVDDCSTDDTVAIAKTYTPDVHVRKWDVEGRHRNYAYSLAKSDYILTLDSDERVTPELADEILALMQEGFKYDCYNVPHKNFIGGYWIRHGGWYPNAKLKLFKKKLPIYEETEPHPRMLILGERFTLKGHLNHLAYDDFSHVIAKLNNQTGMEAHKWVKDSRKMNAFICGRKAVDRFFRAYLGKKGYKDGLIGFMLALSGGFYQILTYAKYREEMRPHDGPPRA